MAHYGFGGDAAAHGIADEHRRAIGLSDQAHDGRHPVAHRSEGGKRVALRYRDAPSIRVTFPAFRLFLALPCSFPARQLEIALALVQVGGIGAVTGRLQPPRHLAPRGRCLGETVQQDVRGLCWNRGLQSGRP